MSPHDLARVLEGLGRPRVLVLGDLMLDRYTWGDAQRISQEAPVIVLRADRREARPGGAANVANMLLALEADVTCAGVVGGDAAGDELRELLATAGANAAGDPDRRQPADLASRNASSAGPTAGIRSQILRVDHESCEPLERRARDAADRSASKRNCPGTTRCLISDYGKGVCTPRRAAGRDRRGQPGAACR